MPKKIIAAVKKSVRKAHPNYSEKQVNSETYATMNKLGYMHGSKETASGVKAEKKYARDHKRRGGGKSRSGL